MRPVLLALLSLLIAAPAAADVRKEAKKFATGAEVIAALAHQIPTDVWGEARCATVLNIGKGGFIVGGTGGWGVVSCREKGGAWSPPALLKVGGPTVGAQIGGAKVQVLMVFVDVKDIEDVVHATPVFQNTAQATAGNAGAGVSGGGNPGLVGGVMSVSKSSGLYAGATWEGLVIDPDRDAIDRVYGNGTSVENVLVKPTKKAPEEAASFLNALKEHAKK